LTKSEIENDLKVLDDILQNKSSYQGLNGFDYRLDFRSFLETMKENTVTKSDFGLFLSKTISKIGDRHSSISGYDLPESLYFPLAFAPYHEKILVIDYDSNSKTYNNWNPEYPYLKAINSIPIEAILPLIRPGDLLAPHTSYFSYAVRDLRDIETVFSLLKKELSQQVQMTLCNEKADEKIITVSLVPKQHRSRIWDERYNKNNFFFDLNDEQRNDKGVIEKFFVKENGIAYIQITSMLEKEESPVFFDILNNFMEGAKESEALIIDVRDNAGGTRDLIQELAGYLIHPDSIYVVNAVNQRGEQPLSDEFQEELHSRFLFAKSELNTDEQKIVNDFTNSFQPTYDLDKKKFSDFYYYVLNGKKLSNNRYHYNKPIYILANEKTFSAASVLVSVFKGLPNITIVGVNTDGSSGNSERFELPNSGLKGKISTMVSFQKNGKLLDGIGTSPDIQIERNLDQIFWKEDYQLNKLKELIQQKFRLD